MRGKEFIFFILSISYYGYARCPVPKNPDKPFKSNSIGKFYNLKPNPIGSIAPDTIKKSRVYKISYHSHGLEYRNACLSQARLRSLDAYLAYKSYYENASVESLAAFKEHAEIIINQPRAISDIVDRCFAQIRSKWAGCGGKYAKTARYMMKIRDELQVQIMPTAFMAFNSTGGAKIWAAGMADADKRTIFASISTLSPSPGASHYVRSLESLVCWEMGNNFSMNHGKRPSSLAQELGFQTPCEFYRN